MTESKQSSLKRPRHSISEKQNPGFLGKKQHLTFICCYFKIHEDKSSPACRAEGFFQPTVHMFLTTDHSQMHMWFYISIQCTRQHKKLSRNSGFQHYFAKQSKAFKPDSEITVQQQGFSATVPWNSPDFQH